MSDPVTNAEVEDVLSSIRRLVSEDKRPLQSRPSEPDTAENDRLVLTPSLRIADDPEPDAVEDDVDDEVETAAESVAPQTPEQADDEAESASVEDPPELEDLLDDGSDDFFVEEETGEITADKDLAASAVDELADDYTDDPYNFDQDEALNADEAETQDVELSEPDAEEETQGPSDEDILASLSSELADRADEAELKADDPPEASEPDVDPMSPAVLAADISKEASLSAKIEALETAIGKIPDRWEPDGKGSDDYAGTDAASIAWEEEVQRDGTGAPVEGADLEQPSDGSGHSEQLKADKLEDGGESESADAPTLEMPIPTRAVIEATHAARTAETSLADRFDDGGEDQLLDEEALRDMVSEIVRAELQGALGERITRNVRKLVRREIHRALTAQDLE